MKLPLILSLLCITGSMAQYRDLAPLESPTSEDRILVDGKIVRPEGWQSLDPSAHWQTDRPVPHYTDLTQQDWTHGVWWVRLAQTEKWFLVTEVRPNGITAGREIWTFAECGLMLERSRTCTAKDWTICRKILP